MLVEYIRYRIPHERQERFEDAYSDAASLDASEHCIAYELSHGVEESERYILRIEWDSLNGHEQGFRHSRSSTSSLPRCARSSTRSRRCTTTTSSIGANG